MAKTAAHTCDEENEDIMGITAKCKVVGLKSGYKRSLIMIKFF